MANDKLERFFAEMAHYRWLILAFLAVMAFWTLFVFVFDVDLSTMTDLVL